MPWWSIIGIFLIVTSVMSLLLVRSIAQPLNRLGSAFNAVGRGQLSHKVEVDNPASEDKRFASNAQFARLFEQFNDMTARIAALIQNQKRQSADISHELRTPLTRLQMTLALVRKKSDDATILPLLERAERESELLNLHIQRLSDLTTMEAHAIQQGRQLLTTEALLDDLCEDAAFEAKGMNIAWQHSLCSATLNIYEEPFVTAIENVVRNAFKYASSSVSLSQPKTKAISINDSGQVFLDAYPVTITELEDRLRTEKALNPDFPLIVRGDAAVQYQKVVEVLDLLRQLELSKVGLVTGKPGQG